MGTKVKGLLKGLRYISQMFDQKEEEQEMQIGYPTDVKHVAHIGCDSHSANPPSWMNEFRSSLVSGRGGGSREAEEYSTVVPKRRGKDHLSSEAMLAREAWLAAKQKAFTGGARPGQDLPRREPGQSRRQKSGADSVRKAKGSASAASLQQAVAGEAMPKQARKKKTKVGSSSLGGSSRSSTAKASAPPSTLTPDKEVAAEKEGPGEAAGAGILGGQYSSMIAPN